MHFWFAAPLTGRWRRKPSACTGVASVLYWFLTYNIRNFVPGCCTSVRPVSSPRSLKSPIGLVLYNLFYWPYLLGSVVVLFFPALALFLLTFWQRPRRWLHVYTTHWAAHYLSRAPYASISVKGREHALGLRSCVFVVNHQSMVDILAVYGIDLPFLWVSKAENFYVPFLGWNMWMNGYVPLKRGNLPSIRRMLRTCEARLKEGASLCVFPEGTRSRDGNLRAFYRGAFWIAVRNGVPIVPVVVEGTGKILAKGKFGIRPQAVTLELLEPIQPAAADFDDRRLRDMTFERMRSALERIRAEAKPTPS